VYHVVFILTNFEKDPASVDAISRKRVYCTVSGTASHMIVAEIKLHFHE
jgi:hypothetical protein